jgi:hypothetical protein
MRRLLVVCGVLVGCPAEPTDPGDVVLPDDDDSGDDDTVGDDDTAGDDDVGSPNAAGWLLWRSDLAGNGLSDEAATHGRFSFGSFSPPGLDAPFAGSDGRPLPGHSLEPLRRAALGVGEGCVELSSDADLGDLPVSDGVGGEVRIVGSGGAPTLLIPLWEGRYALDQQSAPGASTWDLVVEGGGDFPPATWEGALSFPDPLTDPLPGPGSVGNLAQMEIHWTQLGNPQGVEFLFVRATGGNGGFGWRAVLCNADDDGSFFVDASSLASGNGNIEAFASRATWTAPPVGEGPLGAVRTTRWLLTPG